MISETCFGVTVQLLNMALDCLERIVQLIDIILDCLEMFSGSQECDFDDL